MAHVEAVTSIEQLIAAALGLGAASVGGPLSAREARLVAGIEPLHHEALADEITSGGDPIGDAFLRLRSARVRRDAGAFYTPRPIVEPMVRWALDQGPTRLVDPGCGSGRFAVEAVRQDPTLEVVAVDLDPVATLLARANLAVIGAQNVRVINTNYLSLRLPDAGKTAWVGNPPYVRHHELDPRTKRWAALAAGALGHRISGLAGLHALFFLATARKARPGDVGSFVTSAEWLDVGYGSVVRKLLLDGLGGQSLDMFDPRSMPFADVMTTAVITCFKVGDMPNQIAFQRLSAQGGPDIVLGNGMVIEAKAVTANRRWSPLFSSEARAEGATLGEVARVHRGTATGANDFFVMSKAEAEEQGLTEWARPVIGRAQEILESTGVVRDGPERRVVIDLPPLPRDELPQAAHDFIAKGEEQKIDHRYLAAHRQPWWYLGVSRPPIVASYMARRAPKFALNPDGLVILNIAHGVWPTDASADPAVLVARLNDASESFVGAGRTYHGGLEKFEPREMEALVLP